MSRVDLAELDFFSPEVEGVRSVCINGYRTKPRCGKCPEPTCSLSLDTMISGRSFAILRGSRAASVHSGAGSSNEDADAIYKQGYEMVKPLLLTQDPPRHRVYRNLVNKVFSNKRIEGMRDDIQSHC